MNSKSGLKNFQAAFLQIKLNYIIINKKSFLNIRLWSVSQIRFYFPHSFRIQFFCIFRRNRWRNYYFFPIFQFAGVAIVYSSTNCKESKTRSTSSKFLPVDAGYVIMSLTFLAGSIISKERTVAETEALG